MAVPLGAVSRAVIVRRCPHQQGRLRCRTASSCIRPARCAGGCVRRATSLSRTVTPCLPRWPMACRRFPAIRPAPTAGRRSRAWPAWASSIEELGRDARGAAAPHHRTRPPRPAGAGAGARRRQFRVDDSHVRRRAGGASADGHHDRRRVAARPADEARDRAARAHGRPHRVRRAGGRRSRCTAAPISRRSTTRQTCRARR